MHTWHQETHFKKTQTNIVSLTKRSYKKMKNLTQHKGVLEILTRMDSSANGNPRFLLRIDGIKCVTGVDSTLGYSVQNFASKQVEAVIGSHYGRATLAQLRAPSLTMLGDIK